MRYLGIDWGIKKIGLAISEGQLATPLRTITVAGINDAITKIEKVADEEKIDILVIGQPEGAMGKIVKKVVKQLKTTELKVEVADETLSSKQAASMMVELGYSQQKRQEDDAMAAAIILQAYLDGQKKRSEVTGSVR